MPLFFAGLAAIFFAVAFFNFAKCAFIEPDLWPGFRAGLLPPVIFFGPGGSIPGSGSGGSPVDGPFGLTGVTKPISRSSCPFCNLVRMITLMALFMLISSPGAGTGKRCFHLPVIVQDVVIDVQLGPNLRLSLLEVGLW